MYTNNMLRLLAMNDDSKVTGMPFEWVYEWLQLSEGRENAENARLLC